MALFFRPIGNAAEVVGRRPLALLGATPPSRSGLPSEPRASASGFAVVPNAAIIVLGTDAPVPQPEQGCGQADGGVGRGPGGPPHHLFRCPLWGKMEWHKIEAHA